MWTVGELAREFGVSTSALRYYERRGLLISAARVGGRRVYDAAAVRRLAFLRLGQQAGLSLDEIKLMPAGADDAAWRPPARLRLASIEAEITQLRSAKALLEQALRCPDEHPLEECPYSQRKVDQVLQELDPGAGGDGSASAQPSPRKT